MIGGNGGRRLMVLGLDLTVMVGVYSVIGARRLTRDQHGEQNQQGQHADTQASLSFDGEPP